MTVAQKCSAATEIQKHDQPTYLPMDFLIWVGARDTSVSKKVDNIYINQNMFIQFDPIPVFH